MQVVLATGEGNLVCLEITDNKIQEKAHVQLQGEVSCIDITPLDEGDCAEMAAVGTWDMQVYSSMHWLPAGDVASEIWA